MSTKHTALDEQLFTSEAFAQLPGAALGAQFKDVTLKTKVGEFEAGTKFAFAILLGDASALILIDEARNEHAFRLGVSVGEAIPPDEFQGDEDEHEHGPGCSHDHG